SLPAPCCPGFHGQKGGFEGWSASCNRGTMRISGPPIARINSVPGAAREVMRTAAEVNRVTLRIEGSRAVSGVGLSDFESFIKHFLRALRVFHRSLRREPAKKPGRPDRHEELVTAF